MPKRAIPITALCCACIAGALFAVSNRTQAQSSVGGELAEGLDDTPYEPEPRDLAAFRANLAALQAAAPATPDDLPCEPHELAWRITKDDVLCTLECTSDADCAPDERCHVMRRGEGPGTRLFADDVDLKEGDRGICDPFHDVVLATSEGAVEPWAQAE